MATAGYAVSLKVSGDAIAMTDETMTALGGGVFRIASVAKRVIDPDTAVSVELDGAPVSSDAYTVDYLFGRVTFVDTGTEGLVGITAAYLPTLTVGESRGGSLSLSRDELDTSTHGTTHKSAILGMFSGEVSLSTLRLLETSIDVAGDADTWRALLSDGTAKLLEVDLGTGLWRGWVRFPSLASEIPPDGLVTGNVTARTVTRAALGRSEVVSYGFGE